MRAMSRGLSIGMGFVVAIGAFAAPAQASVKEAGGYSYVSKTEKVGAEEAEKLTAKCPSGTHVLAGGQEITADWGDTNELSDYPVDLGDKDKSPDDGWQTRVSYAFKSQVKVEAVCADVKPKYVKDSLLLDGEDQVNLNPECDTHKETALDLGLGIPADFADAIAINSSFTSGFYSWAAFIDNDSVASTFVKTTLVCLKGVKVDAPPADPVSVEDGQQVTNTVDCPSKTFAISGGQGNGGGKDEIAQVGSSTLDEDTYVATVDNLTNNDTIVSSTSVLCAKKLK